MGGLEGGWERKNAGMDGKVPSYRHPLSVDEEQKEASLHRCPPAFSHAISF